MKTVVGVKAVPLTTSPHPPLDPPGATMDRRQTGGLNFFFFLARTVCVAQTGVCGKVLLWKSTWRRD